MDCPNCHMPMPTRAHEFLHASVHAEPWGGLGLNRLPFVLYDRVAKLLSDYAAEVLPTADFLEDA